MSVYHKPLFALFDASEALTVSTNMLRLGKSLGGQYKNNWVIRMNHEWADERLKEALTRLEDSKAIELKPGLSLEPRENFFSHRYGTSEANLHYIRVPYHKLETQNLDLSILDPVLSMEALQKIVFTVRRMLRTPSHNKDKCKQWRMSMYKQRVLYDLLEATHLVQRGMRHLARQMWGERLRERLYPVHISEQRDLGQDMCYLQFNFAEVQELFCARN